MTAMTNLHTQHQAAVERFHRSKQGWGYAGAGKWVRASLTQWGEYQAALRELTDSFARLVFSEPIGTEIEGPEGPMVLVERDSRYAVVSEDGESVTRERWHDPALDGEEQDTVYYEVYESAPVQPVRRSHGYVDQVSRRLVQIG